MHTWEIWYLNFTTRGKFARWDRMAIVCTHGHEGQDQQSMPRGCLCPADGLLQRASSYHAGLSVAHGWAMCTLMVADATGTRHRMQTAFLSKQLMT